MSVNLSISSQDMGKMAGEVEAWFKTVTDVAEGAEAEIMAPIDFVTKDVLQTGSDREVARAAFSTTNPAYRSDGIAAAIAAGRATAKQSDQNAVNFSGCFAVDESQKSFGSPTDPTLLQQVQTTITPLMNAPQKLRQTASLPAFMIILRLVILVLMVLSGVVLTHMMLVKMGKPGILDKPIRHGKHLLHMVRGKHHDKHAKCDEYAAIGGCAKNPVFMNEMCRTTCYNAAPFDEDLVDTNSHCTDWAPHGECLNNPKFMMLNCPKSCSEIEKVHAHQRAEVEADMDRKEAAFVAQAEAAVQGQDKSEYCPHWAAKGECSSNPDFMTKECPKSCAAQ